MFHLMMLMMLTAMKLMMLMKLTSVQHLINKYNSNPFVKNSLGSNILHYCAFQNDVNMVDYVMSIKGVPELINEHNRFGYTPVLLGAHQGNVDFVKHLIEVYGADISITNGQDGSSLLHFVVKYFDLDMIDYVLSKDPMLLEACDKFHTTPVFNAAAYGSLNVVKHLVENHKANVGTTILHFACRSDSVELVDYIISLDLSRVESVHGNGRTPLFYAVFHNKPQIFQHLVDKYNENAYYVSYDDTNFMHHAIRTDNPKTSNTTLL
jgi:ankyrin repeat protein